MPARESSRGPHDRTEPSPVLARRQGWDRSPMHRRTSPPLATTWEPEGGRSTGFARNLRLATFGSKGDPHDQAHHHAPPRILGRDDDPANRHDVGERLRGVRRQDQVFVGATTTLLLLAPLAQCIGLVPQQDPLDPRLAGTDCEFPGSVVSTPGKSFGQGEDHEAQGRFSRASFSRTPTRISPCRAQPLPPPSF